MINVAGLLTLLLLAAHLGLSGAGYLAAPVDRWTATAALIAPAAGLVLSMREEDYQRSALFFASGAAFGSSLFVEEHTHGLWSAFAGTALMVIALLAAAANAWRIGASR